MARGVLLAALLLAASPRAAEPVLSMATAGNYNPAIPGSFYPFGCVPNTGALGAIPSTTPKAVAYGETTYLCLTINGKMTSIYNVVVDQYSAVTVLGSNFASPAGAGYWVDGQGWTSSPVLNASSDAAPQTLYTVFDVGTGLTYSSSARVYKEIGFLPVGNGELLTKTVTTYPLWTVIIDLVNGVPSSIAWDDGCFFCAANTPTCGFTAFDANSSVCSTVEDEQYRSCSSPETQCYPNYQGTVNASSAVNTTYVNLTAVAANVLPGPVAPNTTAAPNSTVVDTGCDLKVFITWTGTDRNGAYMTSANKRFSRFRAFAVATAFQSAVDIGNNALDFANSALGAVEGIPGSVIPAFGNDDVGAE